MHTRNTRRMLSTALASGMSAAVGICSIAAAQETHWVAPRGGSFLDGTNWDSGVPGPNSVAVFDLKENIDVTVGANATSNQLFIYSGDVTLLLKDFSLLLQSALVWTPSLIVGADAGDMASLSLVGGNVSGGFAVIGDEAGAYGELALDNATLDLGGSIWLGLGGDGALDLSGQSLLLSNSATIGSLAGSAGSAMITEAQWQTASHVVIGQLLGTQGHVTVAGPAARWMIGGDLDVGMRDAGTLTISEGGEVHVHGDLYVGTFKQVTVEPPQQDDQPQDKPHGEVLITGAESTLVVDGDLWVSPPTLLAPWNVGRLTLEDGGRALTAGHLHQGGPIEIILSEGVYADDVAIEAASVEFAYPHAPHLTVKLAGGFTPQVGDQFRIISLPPAEVSLNLPGAPAGLQWSTVHASGQTHIRLVGGSDLTGDGIVDVFDLLELLSVWGACGSGPGCLGDINHDGVVDVFDLLQLLADWG